MWTKVGPRPRAPEVLAPVLQLSGCVAAVLSRNITHRAMRGRINRLRRPHGPSLTCSGYPQWGVYDGLPAVALAVLGDSPSQRAWPASWLARLQVACPHLSGRRWSYPLAPTNWLRTAYSTAAAGAGNTAQPTPRQMTALRHEINRSKDLPS
jgi:hypothetical protein